MNNGNQLEGVTATDQRFEHYLTSLNPSPDSHSGAVIKKSNVAGLVTAAVIGGGAVILSVISVPFITPALRRICLPYIPATDAQVKNVFQALKGRKGSLLDLGSGDGRIVFEAARNGFQGVGVELNPWLVAYSKVTALRLGVSSSARFHRKNIWHTDLVKFDHIVIFGVDSMMELLEVKCRKEIKPGSVVVACRFPFPNLTPLTTVGEGIDTVWLYVLPDLFQRISTDA